MYPGEVELLFYRPTDPSFPSNTAATAFAFASGIWLGNRKVGYFLLLPAFLVSFARVFIGVHYPFDILGAALVGIAASLGALLVLRIFEPLPTWILKGMRWLYLA
jgi:undecaprenyl-diphosphatase